MGDGRLRKAPVRSYDDPDEDGGIAVGYFERRWKRIDENGKST